MKVVGLFLDDWIFGDGCGFESECGKFIFPPSVLANGLKTKSGLDIQMYQEPKKVIPVNLKKNKKFVDFDIKSDKFNVNVKICYISFNK